MEPIFVVLGRPDGSEAVLPNSIPFLYVYGRKEEVLSARIERMQSSLSDLLLFELHEQPGVPLAELSEFANYVAA